MSSLWTAEDYYFLLRIMGICYCSGAYPGLLLEELFAPPFIWFSYLLVQSLVLLAATGLSCLVAWRQVGSTQATQAAQVDELYLAAVA